MEERRGRPKLQTEEDKPRQFQRIYKDNDGVVSTWTYDLDKFPNGPILVENEYPKDWKSPSEEIEESQENLPITKRKYLNPKNGKLVSYARAKMLGLI